jgi:beta-lactamase family protein
LSVLRRRSTMLGLSLALAACAPNLAPLRPTMAPSPVALCSDSCGDSVEMTYLGSGGFLIRHGDDAILTSVSFTQHGMLRTFLPFFPITTDTALVRWMMGRERLDGVSAILVGHAHYDHLLDVPFIAETLARKAGIYGSPTMGNTLWGDTTLRSRLHAITGDSVGTATRAGVWIQPTGSHIRFMALRSSHAPTLHWFFGRLPYTYSSGTYAEPRDGLPRTPRGWRMGEPYAYLVDVLDAANRPAFRIFYQDAAAEPEYSTLPPLALEDQRSVDVAIICAGNFGNARDYPTALLGHLNPKYVVVGHWENFFHAPLPPFEAIPFNSSSELARRLRRGANDNWVTPEPRARIVLRF